MRARLLGRYPTVILVVVAVGAFGCGRSPQVPHQGDDCQPCEVHLTHIATIDGSAEEAFLPDRMVYVVAFSSGDFATPTANGTAVAIYDSLGKFRTLLGKPGNGPGEFQRIRRIFVGDGDSLYVHDWGTGRLTVFGPDLRLVRSTAFPYPVAGVLPSGDFWVAEQVAQAELIGHPVHIIARSGDHQRSFGMTPPDFSPLRPLATRRLAASTRQGHLVTVAPGRYVVERWDPSDGERLDSFEVHSADITPVDAWPDDERERPPGVIEAIWADSLGHFVFLLRVPDKQWAPRSNANTEAPYTHTEYDAMFDWIIEFVEPISRRPIARLRHPTALWARSGSDVVVAVEEDSLGHSMAYRMFRPTLITRRIQP